jgi:hypothetical protein
LVSLERASVGGKSVGVLADVANEFSRDRAVYCHRGCAGGARGDNGMIGRGRDYRSRARRCAGDSQASSRLSSISTALAESSSMPSTMMASIEIRPGQSGAAAGAARRWHPTGAIRAGRDRSGPIPPRLPDGPGGAGLQAPRQHLSRRPVAALGQGEEPNTSRLQPGAGSVLVHIETIWAASGASRHFLEIGRAA